jgi:IS1 family transposase
MWSPMGRIEHEAPAKHDSFCAEPVAKLSPVVQAQPSSTFELPGRKCLWASDCWPRDWDFEAPPECWRSNSIPSGGGWPRQRCIVNRSATCWFEISTFPRFKWMSFGPSLKKTPKSHWTDHPQRPLIAKKGRGRSQGSTWIWRAFAPEFRLRLASLVGNRTLYSARRLLRKIQGCLNGTLPLFTSDSLPHYADVLLELYGRWKKPEPTGLPGRPCNVQRVASPDLRYAQVHKERQGGRVVKVTQSIVFGKRRTVQTEAASLKRADGSEGQINTSYIERDNLALRQELRRLARKTLGFSKNRRELQHALDFIDAHDNFVKPHGALRLKAPSGGPHRWEPRTPAMAAGISDHVWKLEELLSYKA